MRIPLIDLKAQLSAFNAEANEQITQVLADANYILGPEVQKFEKAIASYIGVKHAIGVANGTDALVIALKSLGIGEGDEVIVPAYTFFASAEAISFVGATPVFVDVDKHTYNVDISDIKRKITNKTKAIMPVHLFGQPCDMDAIISIADSHNLYVVEDCAQAIGATYQGKKVGSFGDLGTLSFYPTKNLGCAGDGGMILTNSDKLATIVTALRAHGSGFNGLKAFNYLNDLDDLVDEQSNNKDDTVYDATKYYNYLIGHNSRLDEIQAAILNVKLPFLDSWNSRRAHIAKKYNESFDDTQIGIPQVISDVSEVYHLYILQSDNREELISFLSSKGISTGVYYPVPLHLQKAFAELGYKEGDMPVSEYLSHRTFAIPVYPELTDEQVDYIISAVQEYGK